MAIRSDREKDLYVEQLKNEARLEETLPETEVCPGCAAAREKSGDPTNLCEPHLKRIYGV